MGDAAHRVTSGEPEGGAGGARLPVRAEPSSPPKQDRGQGSTTCRTPDVVEFGMSPFSWRRHSCLLGRDSSRPSSRAASAVPERREESRRRRHECLRHVLAQVNFPNYPKSPSRRLDLKLRRNRQLARAARKQHVAWRTLILRGSPATRECFPSPEHGPTACRYREHAP